jgi:beta-glucosidase
MPEVLSHFSQTGSVGTKAIPKLLWGDVNPSGRTSDTYAYDLSTAASYPNSGTWGIGTYTNSKGHYPADGTLNGNVGTISAYEGVSYYDYQEGIYVGYRWYETADEEGFWDDVDNEHGKGYDGVVQYPFGYGLSYTDFSWEVVDSSIEDGDTISEDSQISVTVRVTNTGQNAGKDVVELYYTAPYYKGGIQKSSVELGAFAKTKLLVPGESQDVTLTFSARDMASYDCYDANKDGFKGYELDAGTYTISLRHDAHTPDETEGSTVSVELPRGAELATDAKTGATVENRFTGDAAEDGVSIDGSNAGYPLTWLDRASFTATYPKKGPNRSMNTAVIEKNLYHAEDAEAAIESTDAAAKYGASGTKTLGDDGSLTELGYALGLDYGNPQWESLLNQMSQAEQEDLVLHGYSNTADIASIGKPQTKEVDGPSQVGSFNQLKYGTGFSNGTVLAQTWNTELAGRIGEALGAEAAYIGVDGIYAPSANLHRSAFGGRNYEYLSEDPVLTGKMAAAEVRGIKNTGTYCFVKHLICNDQDTMRDGLYEWMTEQTLRELYLEPFRILVEEGGATGMMSSYNRIGAVWAGGSEALLTGVLRNEWGFKGAVITDYADHHTYMNADQMLRAGGDLYMDGIMRDGAFTAETDSGTFQQDLRRAAKDVLYVWLNARAQNLQYNETAAKAFVRPIKHAGVPIISITIGVLDAAILTGAVLGGWRKWKKKHEGQEIVIKTPSE